jgi:hypothetical protein
LKSWDLIKKIKIDILKSGKNEGNENGYTRLIEDSKPKKKQNV